MRRDNRRGSTHGHNDRGSFNKSWSNSTPREMHKATCADCGDECEVPFKPTEGRPVFCRECFRKKRDRF